MVQTGPVLIVVLSLTTVFTPLARAIGVIRIGVVGSILTACALFGYLEVTKPSDAYVYVCITAALAASASLSVPIVHYRLAEIASSDHMGFTFAVEEAVRSVGKVIAPVVMGYINGRLGTRATFVIAALCQLLAALSFATMAWLAPTRTPRERLRILIFAIICEVRLTRQFQRAHLHPLAEERSPPMGEEADKEEMEAEDAESCRSGATCEGTCEEAMCEGTSTSVARPSCNYDGFSVLVEDHESVDDEKDDDDDDDDDDDVEDDNDDDDMASVGASGHATLAELHRGSLSSLTSWSGRPDQISRELSGRSDQISRELSTEQAIMAIEGSFSGVRPGPTDIARNGGLLGQYRWCSPELDGIGNGKEVEVAQFSARL